VVVLATTTTTNSYFQNNKSTLDNIFQSYPKHSNKNFSYNNAKLGTHEG